MSEWRARSAGHKRNNRLFLIHVCVFNPFSRLKDRVYWNNRSKQRAADGLALDPFYERRKGMSWVGAKSERKRPSRAGAVPNALFFV
jgi:hypothetical protein